MDRQNTNFDKEHEDSRKYIEDSPRLRSVAMGSQPMSLMNVVPTAKPFAAPSLRFEPAQKQRPARREEVAEWCSKVHPLQPVPAYYCLERTHVVISNCTPQLLAQRISDCLCEESVSATFEGNEATAETSDSVSFSVRFWSGNDEQTIVVEVQRLSGCGFSYQQMARRVLRAAKGEPCSKPPQRQFTLPSCLPPIPPQERQQCIKDALDIAENLLEKNKLDTQLLALESLVQLSSGSRCRSANSDEGKVIAARCILSSDYSFLSTIQSLIQSRLNDDQDVSPLKSHMEQEHSAILHRHALAVLANCLESLAGEATTVVQQLSTNEPLLAALVFNVAQSSSRPHEACLSLRCLHYLSKNAEDTCSRVKTALLSESGVVSGGGGVLVSAQRFGLRHHAQLHEQALAMMVLHQQ